MKKPKKQKAKKASQPSIWTVEAVTECLRYVHSHPQYCSPALTEKVLEEAKRLGLDANPISQEAV